MGAILINLLPETLNLLERYYHSRILGEYSPLAMVAVLLLDLAAVNHTFDSKLSQSKIYSHTRTAPSSLYC